LLKAVVVWLMSTVCFAFIIMFMPNTRVKVGPGFIGGLVTALLFLLWLRTCAALQVGVAKWGRIYGSFAVVPIVLFWVYMSWQIIFFGAEVAFAVQNCSTYRMEQGARLANVEARNLLALSVIEAAGRAMTEGGRPFDASDFAGRRRVPVRFLNDVVSELLNAGLLAELSDRQGAYVLLKSPENLRVREVLSAVLRAGVGPEDLGLLDVAPRVREAAQRASGGMNSAIDQLTVKDLLSDGSSEG
jgi:membrane protein